MIQVLRGESASLRLRALERLRARPLASLWLESPDGSVTSWDGVRRLLAQIRPRIRDEDWSRCIDAHRPAASLVLDGLRISEEDRRAREPLSARMDSYLSHNWALQRPLLEAWARLLVELVEGRGWTLIVPDLAQVDWESAAVLVAMYRQHPERAPRLLVGFDPESRPAEPDVRGIRWGKVPPEQLYLAAMGFHMLPHAEVRVVDGPVPGRPAADGLPKPIEDSSLLGLETAAFRRLTAEPTAEPDTCEQVIEAMDACFRRFAFTSCLRLGVELLDRGAELGLGRVAHVHGMLGLAAHNRQFHSSPNRELEPFLREQFDRAFAAESDPGLRIAHCYRMAVTLGRRMGRLDEAKEWADRGVLLAQKAPLSSIEKARHEAWCRNIRAFLWMRLGRLADAIEDDERAFELLKDVRAEELPSPRELSSTLSVLAHNTAALYGLSGDVEEVHRWRRIAGEIPRGHSGTETWEAHAWIGFCRSQYRLDEALPRARSGLDSARAEREPFHEYHYSLMLADLSYRLGDPETALKWFDRVARLRQRCGDPEYLPSPFLSAACAARRAGRVREAADRFESILTEAEDARVRSEILSCLGVVEAERGRAQRATERIDQAISVAVELGERDVLLRTAVAAGEASRALGRTDDATAAFRQALEIAEVEEDETPPPAGDLLRAILGLLETETDQTDPDLVVDALSLLKPALREDADSWWDLPRLVTLVHRTMERNPNLADRPGLAGSLEFLSSVGRQRKDCEVPA